MYENILGNIMGYVRLIRSAAIKLVSNASTYLPASLNDSTNLLHSRIFNLTKELKLLNATCQAAWNLKINHIYLTKDLVLKPDYFKVLKNFSIFFSI